MNYTRVGSCNDMKRFSAFAFWVSTYIHTKVSKILVVVAVFFVFLFFFKDPQCLQ